MKWGENSEKRRHAAALQGAFGAKTNTGDLPAFRLLGETRTEGRDAAQADDGKRGGKRGHPHCLLNFFSRVRFISIEPLLEPLGEIDLTAIDWVIVGGESGPGARPMEQAWVVGIREQCLEAGVPFFSNNGEDVDTHRLMHL
jgi:hypothetical protein